MPDMGADENVAEMKRCKAKGFKAVRLHTFPSGKNFPTPEDDQVLGGGASTSTCRSRFTHRSLAAPMSAMFI